MHSNVNGPASRITFASLRPGERAVVLGLGGDETLRGSLERLGFVPGTVIEYVRSAPLGDPVEVRLRGTLLAMRRSDLERVELAPA